MTIIDVTRDVLDLSKLSLPNGLSVTRLEAEQRRVVIDHNRCHLIAAAWSEVLAAGRSTRTRALLICFGLLAISILAAAQVCQSVHLGFVRFTSEWYAGGNEWQQWVLADGTTGQIRLDCYSTQDRRSRGILIPTRASEGPYIMYIGVRLQSQSERLARVRKAVLRFDDGTEHVVEQFQAIGNRDVQEFGWADFGKSLIDESNRVVPVAYLMTYQPVELRPSDEVEVHVECDIKFEDGTQTTGSAQFRLRYAPTSEIDFVIPVE